MVKTVKILSELSFAFDIVLLYRIHLGYAQGGHVLFLHRHHRHCPLYPIRQRLSSQLSSILSMFSFNLSVILNGTILISRTFRRFCMRMHCIVFVSHHVYSQTADNPEAVLTQTMHQLEERTGSTARQIKSCGECATG